MSQNGELNQIINQVKSETRNENFKKFFVKNSKILIIASSLILVVAIGFFIFNAYQKSQQDKFSEIFQQSLMDQQEGNLDKAKKGLQEIVETKSVPKNIQALATLQYASIFLDEGDNAKAIALYRKLNKCTGCESYIKDLAGLLIVKVWLSDENEVGKADLVSRIEEIEVSSKNLKYQISEQKAILEMQNNNLEKAYMIFDSLSKNPETDDVMKKRAKESLQMVISKGYIPVIL